MLLFNVIISTCYDKHTGNRMVAEAKIKGSQLTPAVGLLCINVLLNWRNKMLIQSFKKPNIHRNKCKIVFIFGLECALPNSAGVELSSL